MFRRLVRSVVPRQLPLTSPICTSAVARESALQEHEYHRVADQSLDALVEDLEEYFDSVGTSDVDIQYSQGVLTVQMGSNGTYVINKQAPNKQIWLSSPISGPFRYDYENGEWIYHRDHHNMKEKLTTELATLFKKQPIFD